jgi:hypothetical protein
MKIIGEGLKSTFILEAGEYEIAKLMGFCSPREGGLRLAVGDEINIAAMFDRLYTIDHNKERLTRVAGDLRAIAEMCDELAPVIRKMDLETLE